MQQPTRQLKHKTEVLSPDTHQDAKNTRASPNTSNAHLFSLTTPSPFSSKAYWPNSQLINSSHSLTYAINFQQSLDIHDKKIKAQNYFNPNAPELLALKCSPTPNSLIYHQNPRKPLNNHASCNQKIKYHQINDLTSL